MGLRFIIGRAGMGKTQTCLNEIEAELAQDMINGPPLIFLVPEQASFQMEKALTAKVKGLIRAQVMSFRRLGWLVFQEAGGTNRQYLDELGKRMVLRTVLMEKEKSLQVFGGLTQEQGFIEKLAGTFKEFKSYNISPNQLEMEYQRLIDEGRQEEIITKKINDLLVLYKGFESFIAGKETDPDDYLTLLAEKIKEAPSLKEARVWIDSFAGFTPQELEVIGSLLSHCRQVNLTLCIDAKDLNRKLKEMDLFHPTWQTYQKIKNLAHTLEIPIEPIKFLPDNEKKLRFTNPYLAHLEKNFDQNQPLVEKPQGISLVKADNKRVEIEGIARKIRDLSREKGFRYRDMALILRNPEDYNELISTVFQEYQIPFFMDIKRTVGHHPLIELIISALETVNTYWSYEPLFRYLKTDLVRIKREDVDYLENYALKYGIQGSLWLQEKPWQFGFQKGRIPDEKKQEHLNNIRNLAVFELRNFYKQIQDKSEQTAEALALHLYSLLKELKVDLTLENWRRKAEESGNLDEAKEHKQIWDGVMRLIDQLVNVMGRKKMTSVEFAKIIEAGFYSLRLGLIPPALDQVLVGTIERSRQPELKAVFLPGLNEGIFPARIKEEEIFTDQDRVELKEENLELAPTSKLSTFHEQYLSYIAFTRAAEYLWLSYPQADEGGKELKPSFLVAKCQELFPKLVLKSLTTDPDQGDFSPLSYLANEKKAIAYLAEKLQGFSKEKSLGDFWQNLCFWLLEKRRQDFFDSPAFKGLNHDNLSRDLEEELVKSIYGEELKGSVSRLETFMSCPFKFFLQYGLGLKKRDVYRVDAPLKGSFYHFVLNELIKTIQVEERSWRDMDDEELAQLVEEISTETLLTMREGVFLQTSSYQYWAEVMKKNLETAVSILTTHIREGDFMPIATEMTFPLEKDDDTMEIDLDDNKKLKLRGQIDRIDGAVVDGQNYIRVIDYKSSSRDLDLAEVFYGLSLQLPVYLKVALEVFKEEKVKGAGMFYFPVKNPIISLKNPLPWEKVRQEIFREMRMMGRMLANPKIAAAMGVKPGGPPLFNVRVKKDGDFYKGTKVLTERELTELGEYIWHKLGEIGRDIYAGKTEIAPYRLGEKTPCIYCDFEASCQFDSLIRGNQYRVLPRISEEEFWDKIREILERRVDNGQGDKMD